MKELFTRINRFFRSGDDDSNQSIRDLSRVRNEIDPTNKRSVIMLRDVRVSAVFVNAEQTSPVDQLSNSKEVERVIDHMLSRVAKSGAFNAQNIRAMTTHDTPRADRKIVLWQNRDADIHDLVAAANALQTVLGDLGMTRHDPVKIEISGHGFAKITHGVDTSLTRKAGGELSLGVSTPEFLVKGDLKASLGLEHESKRGNKIENERSSEIAMSREVEVGGWAYSAGIVEAITTKLGIPTPSMMMSFTGSQQLIRDSISGRHTEPGGNPFEAHHTNLIALEKMMLEAAKELNIRSERHDLIGRELDLGQTESALRRQLDHCKTAPTMSLEDEAIEEVRLGVLLCAQMYRGARLTLERILCEEAAAEIASIHMIEGVSGLSTSGDVNTKYGDRPKEGFAPISAIGEGRRNEYFLTFERLGLPAFFNVDIAANQVSVIAFPDMTDHGLNVINSERGLNYDDSYRDINRTPVFTRAAEFMGRVEVMQSAAKAMPQPDQAAVMH